MPKSKPWRYILYEDREDGENTFLSLATSTEALQEDIDRFIKDGLDNEFLESLYVAEIKVIRPVEVQTTRKANIGKPIGPS
jgi:hypothetical protein